MNKPVIVGFILIILLVASVITPAVSKQITIDKGNILESNPEQGEGKWFATLRMDFGEDIYNDKICRLQRPWYKPYYDEGRYYVNVSVNFRCPDNRKIEINYSVKAVLYAYDYIGELIYGDRGNNIIFCDFEDSVTIINGSNPPDINEDYEKLCKPYYIWGYLMVLRIEATLTGYKYYDGEWLLNSEGYTLKEVREDINFRKSRTSSFTFENLIERFPNMFPILRHLLRL
jgi:hypothetical protein